MLEYEFKTSPYDHQRRVFLESRDLEGYGIFWEMGTGKTKLCVDTAAYLFQEGQIDSLLVLAPKGVHEIWPEEFEVHCPDEVLERANFFTYHSNKANTKWHRAAMARAMNHKGGLSVICMGYEGVKTDIGKVLAREFLKRRKCMEILDESIRVKTPKTKISKTVQRHRKTALVRRILDGTPISNSPFDIFSPVRFVDPTFWQKEGVAQDFHEFKNYFGEYGEGYAAGGRKFRKFEGYKRMPLLKDLISKVGSRVLKDDVLDLPPKVFRTPYRYDLTREQQRVYDEMDADFETTLASGVELEEEIVLTKLIRLQQIMCGFVGDSYGNLHRIDGKKNPRLDLLKSVVGDSSVNGTQMLIWSHMIPCINDIVNFLGKRCIRYDGTITNDKIRRENLKRFIRGDVQFAVMNQMAAARGHNITNCYSVLYYSNPPGSLDLRLQSEDRCHRLGQTHSVDYGDICSRNTREDEIITSLRKKMNVAAYLMGDEQPMERW